MKRLRVLLVFLILPACEKLPGKPRSLHLRLDVTDGNVRLGKTALPSDGEALSEYIIGLASGNDAKREVDLVFAANTTAVRMIEMFNAVLLCGGQTEDHQIPFNVAGRKGSAFQLDVRDVFCCTSRRFVSADECIQTVSCPGAGIPWVEMELSFHGEEFTLDGASMDRDQLQARLHEVRQNCQGILVMINVSRKATARDLVPVIELCESAGANVNLSCGEEEEEDRHLRSLRARMVIPSFISTSEALPLNLGCSFAEEILK